LNDRREDADPKPGGRIGCWITGAGTLLCAGVFIAAGLFLPPVRLIDRLSGPQLVPLPASGDSLSADGLTLTVAEAGGADFGALITATEADGESPIPGQQYIDRRYQIDSAGRAPASVRVTLTMPDAVPAALTGLYAWDEQGGVRFVPTYVDGRQVTAVLSTLPSELALLAANVPAQPLILETVDVTQTLRPEAAQSASIVAPAGLQPTMAGTLSGSVAAGFDLNAAYRVMPVLRNFNDPRATDPATIETILSNPALRSAHARQIAAFAASGYDGVVIDYRDLPESQRDAFTAFIASVSAALEPTGLSLGVVVPAPRPAEDGLWYLDEGAYDWPALGQHVTLMQVVVQPGDLLDARFLDGMLSALVRQVERSRLLVTLPARSLREAGGVLSPIAFQQALSAVGDVRIEAAQMTPDGNLQPGETFRARLDGFTAAQGTDAGTRLPVVDFADLNGGFVSRIWLMTAEAFDAFTARIAPYRIAGIAFNDLSAPGLAEGFEAAVADFARGIPAAPRETLLSVRWTIQRGDGGSETVDTALNEPLIATASAPEGNYAVNAEIVVNNQSGVPRAGAALSVFLPSPTFTPSPTATATPTPLPTATPTPVEIVSVSPSQLAAASAPVSGSIVVGQFEYGGHVASTQTNFAEAMRRAGMTWMKVQVRYFPGMSPSDAGNLVSEAHGRGFRILLGIVGSPGDLAAGGEGYMRDFAGFLASVASYGPDAIEVWNEPNLDREWPEGQISGTYYAQMLQLAYNAIKASNAGVMVISGAPAPTGAEAAYPGRVMNDDNWIRQLVQAGGLNYMDCLGAHYNEGIVPPSLTSGDPRDGYYTRYFRGMLNVYAGLVGGARPICFTELGYLTPEGFPPLPSYFAWAQNVTLAQQAAWLAEAAAIASQSGIVRLMIIWNIDFTSYDSDPQAGYAIVRPGGGCPACDALAGAR
jgi:hypothetical protein